MRAAFPSEVFKVWLYAAASVLLGAWVSPLIYNAGKALAEVSSVKQTNGPLQWLADICRTADFPEFFEASMLGAAVVLFLPFLHWLQVRSPAGEGRHLADRSRGWIGGQRLNHNPLGPRQGATGFFSVTVVFLLLAGALVFTGVFVWKHPAESLGVIALRGFITAVALAIFQEMIFRGIAMGIFLRAMGPLAAIALTALLFALLHFLIPPSGFNVPDPDASGVGFELLRKIVGRLAAEPRVVLGTLAPLLALGAVLAYARWRTASLWLPIGLHAGWIFVNAVLASVTVAAFSLQHGLIPLAVILLLGVGTRHLTRPDDATVAQV